MSRCTWPPRVSTGPSLRAQPETRTLVSRPMGRPCSVQAYAPTFVIVGGAQPEALQSPCMRREHVDHVALDLGALGAGLVEPVDEEQRSREHEESSKFCCLNSMHLR